MRKEQRNLHDAVAIQYAKMAMGETARGLFDTTREFATWEEFMQALKPKFLLHTAEYQLLVETHSWQMNGDWPVPTPSSRPTSSSSASTSMARSSSTC